MVPGIYLLGFAYSLACLLFYHDHFMIHQTRIPVQGLILKSIDVETVEIVYG